MTGSRAGAGAIASRVVRRWSSGVEAPSTVTCHPRARSWTAAMRSGVSQPTLTRAIQRLEQELGGTLVYRDGKDSRLTALGRDIRSEFAEIADREQRIRAISLNRVRGRRELPAL